MKAGQSTNEHPDPDGVAKGASGAARGGLVPPAAGDLFGGLAALAILLPQAMAFGVTLFTGVGFDAATGAFAGLVTTAALCIASGLANGTRGLIAAPTGPTLVLLVSASVSLADSGLTGGALATGMASVVILTGLLQIILGASGGGRLIKYIPYPVVSGFMTGSAILMILSQAGPLRGITSEPAWQNWWWLPATTALVTIAAARLTPKWLPAIPGPIAGLALGTVSFHSLALLNPAQLPSAWMVGSLPSFGGSTVHFNLTGLSQLPWHIVVPAALALAVLASLDTLLTAVVADVATARRHDSRRELIGQGTGHLLSGLAGGMAGAGTTAATVVAIKSGGGRWVAVAAGLLFVVLARFAGDSVKLLPVGALAGVIFAVAFDVADTDLLSWLRRQGNRQEAAVALLVTLITVLYDLMIAVGVGVAIAILLFVRDQITAAVIHRRSSARETRSIRNRPERERRLLETHGERIVVYELRGHLFFGTADRLIDELGHDLDGPNWIVLDLSRVLRIDLTAIRFLQQIANRLGEQGGHLLCSEVHHGTGIAGTFEEALHAVSPHASAARVTTLNSRDEALELAEDALLQALGCEVATGKNPVPLERNDISRYCDADQVRELARHLSEQQIEAGDYLFRQGDETDELYLVAAGQIEIRVPTTAHHYHRLAIYSAGSFFGELALLRPGSRAAHAVARTDSRCWILERAVFEAVKGTQPAMAIALLAAICDRLVANQRWSTRELQHLARW